MAAEEKDKPLGIGGYVLLKDVAHGGLASVHLGRRRGPGTQVLAIKRLEASFAEDPEFVSSFLREGRLATRIRHPNVVSVLDVVAADNEVILVMEYVHGESLSHWIRVAGKQRIGIPRRVLVTIMVSVLSGLHAAHEVQGDLGAPAGLVHGDASPHDLLIGLDGVPKVLNFGLAQVMRRARGSLESGPFKTKYAYMSPEQLTSGTVDRRADVYSTGAMLWEGLTGHRLFDPKSTPELSDIVAKIQAGQIRPPSAIIASTPQALDAIVMKALSPSPADRFATAEEMAVALEKAVPSVPASLVGEWVAKVAGNALEARAAEIEEIESLELPASPAPALAPAPAPAPAPVAKPNPAAPRPPSVATRSVVRVPPKVAQPLASVPTKPAVGSAPAAANAPPMAMRPRVSTLLGLPPNPPTPVSPPPLPLSQQPQPPAAPPPPRQPQLPATPPSRELRPPADASPPPPQPLPPVVPVPSQPEPATAAPIPAPALAAPAPSLPPEPVDLPMPSPPRRWVWGVGVACGGLLLLAVWLGGSRREGVPEPGVAAPASPPESAPASESRSSSATAAPSESASESMGTASPGTANPGPEEDVDAAVTSEPEAESPPTPAPTPRAATAPSRPNCNPPFTIDSEGIRVPKRECFR